MSPAGAVSGSLGFDRWSRSDVDDLAAFGAAEMVAARGPIQVRLLGLRGAE